MSQYNVTVSLSGAGQDYSTIFNVKKFGAIGDGVTDDTAAINSTIVAAAAAGRDVLIPASEYKLSSMIIAEQQTQFANLTIDARGAVFNFDTGMGTPLVKIGTTANRSYGVDWIGGKVWFGNTSTLDWVDTIGFQLMNSSSCRIIDVDVYGCGIGIDHRADGVFGVSYNKVEPRTIINCLNPLNFQHEGAAGSWVTENIVIGGKIDYTSLLNSVDCSAGAACRMRGDTGVGAEHSECNKLYGVSFERAPTIANPPKLIDMEGRYHMFSGIRTEGFGTDDISCAATSGNNAASFGNMFIGGRAYRWKDMIDSTSLGYCQVMGGNSWHISGESTASNPLLKFENGGASSGTAAIELIDNDTYSRYRVSFNGDVTVGVNGPQRLYGNGSPEGVVLAVIGSTYQRLDGGAGTSFYVKESSPTSTSGWVGK